MRSITQIVIHASATPPGMDIGAEEIRGWHKQRGWSDIGYHAVIRRNGKVEDGRNIERAGAHVKGHNENSFGICLVGGTSSDASQAEFNFTRHQMASLVRLLDVLKNEFPDAEVLGHRDFPGVAKACPCFNVRAWYV